jgi:hypothetical protein
MANVYGSPGPVRRMLAGPFFMLDLGDSVTDRLKLNWMGMFPAAVPFGGFVFPGSGFNGQNNGGAVVQGGFGFGTLMGSQNYTVFQALEKSFNGTAYGANQNGAWNRWVYGTFPRAYSSSAPGTNLTRITGNFGALTDWLSGNAFTRHDIYYANGGAPAGLESLTYRDADKATCEANTPFALNANGFTLTTSASGTNVVSLTDDLYLGSRVTDNASPNGNIALCCSYLKLNTPCWVYGSAAVGGTILGNYLTTDTRISAAAWQQLALMGVTTVRIAFGQNENDGMTRAGYVTQLQLLISQIRAYVPTCDIILVSQYQTQGATPAKLTTLALSMKDVAQSTANVSFLDMNGLFPTYAPIASWLLDGTHPSVPGAAFFTGAQINLALQLAGQSSGGATTAPWRRPLLVPQAGV